MLRRIPNAIVQSKCWAARSIMLDGANPGLALLCGGISGIMAMNLLGAIVGGLLEYNSMYLGFQALYLMAMACYILAFVSERVFTGKDTQPVAAAPI